jgi:hypothetical protein
MVEILVVLALALAAGAAVYRLSLYLTGERTSPAPGGSGFLPREGLLPAATGAADLPPGYRYAVLAPGRRSWQTRLIGFLGIVVLVCLGAMALALAVYEVSHLIRITLDGYVSGPSPTPGPRVGG